jgi:hypothetical protein
MKFYEAIPMVALDPHFPLQLATAGYFAISVMSRLTSQVSGSSAHPLVRSLSKSRATVEGRKGQQTPFSPGVLMLNGVRLFQIPLLNHAQERLPDVSNMLSVVQDVTEAHGVSRQKMVSSLQIYSLEIMVVTESWAEVRSLCKVCTWINITW